MRYLLRYIRLHATFRQLVKFMSLELEKGVQDMDMYELLSRVTLEVMGEAGLGYSFDELNNQIFRLSSSFRSWK